ncbi:hypothetical protein C8J31_105143 [Rhizobium sp. PP-CC-2G-626]|nr:hypothetical protein C8J31_105143 [Rhizobium sp. PP-CC-2G-626]
MAGIPVETPEANQSAVAALIKAVFGYASGQNLKPSGDTRGGALDGYIDSSTGYILHFQTGANSGSASAAIAVGTDGGQGSAFLASVKNSGAGYRVSQNPGAGYGIYATGYSVNPLFLSEVYSGGKGLRLKAQLGAGFADGVSTQGSTTFTSATAAFAAGDVGKTITQLTSKPGSSVGCVPAGATITAVTNATTVEMSLPATQSGTGVMFLVGTRALGGSEEFLSFYGTDNIRRGAIFYSLFDWSTGGRFTASFQSQPAFIARAFNASQTGDLLQAVSSADVVLSRINKNGAIGTRVTTAPADADIANSEAFFYWDPTPGATKLMIKGKDSAGAVVTKQVT